MATCMIKGGRYGVRVFTLREARKYCRKYIPLPNQTIYRLAPIKGGAVKSAVTGRRGIVGFASQKTKGR